MDKRRVWREQEQKLVERWNEATERFRVAHEAAASPGASADGSEAPAEERALKVEAAREIGRAHV